MENFFFAFLDELGHLEAKKRIVEMMENDGKSDPVNSPDNSSNNSPNTSVETQTDDGLADQKDQIPRWKILHKQCQITSN